MGKTKIAWADFTFNGWVGCTKVSPGCHHCYAEAFDKRVGGAPKSEGKLRWGVGAPRTKTSASYWKQPLKWAKDAVSAGERWRVFCASLADWLDPEVPDAWRLELLDLIERTPELDWLLLTKRPEQWRGALGRAIAVCSTTPVFALSLFSGGGGLDLGLEAGVRQLAAVAGRADAEHLAEVEDAIAEKDAEFHHAAPRSNT